MRGGGQVHDGVVVFSPGSFICERPSPGSMPLRVIAREVRADGLPTHAAVRRLEYHIPGVIYRIPVKRVRQDWGIPVETVFLVFRGSPQGKLRVFLDLLAFPRGLHPFFDNPLVASSIDHIGVIGVKSEICAFTACHRIPVLPVDTLVAGTADDGNGRVVLLPPIDIIREPVVRNDPVKLGRRLVFLGTPGLTAVSGDIGPAVIGIDHDPVVLRVDPQVVVIPVGRCDGLKCFSPVDGACHRGIQHIDALRVLRVRKNLHIIPGAGHIDPVLVDLPPGFTPVVRPVDTCLLPLGFQDGVYQAGLCTGGGNPRFPEGFRKPFGELFPGTAPVCRFIEAGGWPPGFHRPGIPAMFPHGGVQYPWVPGVHAQGGGPGPIVHKQDPFPVRSPVCRPVDAPLPARSVLGPLYGDVIRVVFGWVDDDVRDMPALGQADMPPGIPGVTGDVHPVAHRGHHPPGRVFPHPHKDQVRIRFADRNIPDRAGLEETVRDVFPRQATVFRFPYSAPGTAHVVGPRDADDPGSRYAPPTPERADVTPGKPRIQGIRQGRRRGSLTISLWMADNSRE